MLVFIIAIPNACRYFLVFRCSHRRSWAYNPGYPNHFFLPRKWIRWSKVWCICYWGLAWSVYQCNQKEQFHLPSGIASFFIHFHLNDSSVKSFHRCCRYSPRMMYTFEQRDAFIPVDVNGFELIRHPAIFNIQVACGLIKGCYINRWDDVLICSEIDSPFTCTGSSN